MPKEEHERDYGVLFSVLWAIKLEGNRFLVLT
jgi:hypothetical protein